MTRRVIVQILVGVTLATSCGGSVAAPEPASEFPEGSYPVPRVGVGADGWLYLADEFTAPCESDAEPSDIAESVDLVASIVSASGRHITVLLAPGKDGIHPEHLGALAGDAACAAERRTRLRAALAAADPPGWIDTWSLLERWARHVEVYYPQDSHWNSLAAVVVTRAIVVALGSGLFSWWDVSSESVEAGRRALAAWIGSELRYPALEMSVDRGEVLRIDDRSDLSITRYETSAAGPLYEGEVLVVHDSFGVSLQPFLPQYVRVTTWANWNLFAGDQQRFSRLAEMVRDSDAVVVESSERGSYRRFGRTFVPLSGALVRALIDDLSALAAPPTVLTEGVAVGGDGAVASPVGERDVRLAIVGEPTATRRYLVARVRSGAAPVVAHSPSSPMAQEAPLDPSPGEEQLLVWDLTAAGDPPDVYLELRGSSLEQILVVTIP